MKRATSKPKNLTINESALEIMKSWEGFGEQGGNNRGWFVSFVTRNQNGSWCAALIYSAIELAYKARGEDVPFQRTHGARRLVRDIADNGYFVDKMDLQPGDVYCLPRGTGWQGHVGMVVERTERLGFYKAIDGNVGANAKVRIFYIDLSRLEVVGCARLSTSKKKNIHVVPPPSELYLAGDTE